METSIVSENVQETIIYLESRINQLEEALLGLAGSFWPIYGAIDFAHEPPESFDTPYSMHAMLIPHTKLNVTFVTTPPHLVIGAPESQTSGPLRWDHLLEIELPTGTKFVSFRYGGATGDMEWVDGNGSSHPLPALPVLQATGEVGHFYLAKSEGIRRLKITSNGKMFLDNLAIGIPGYAASA